MDAEREREGGGQWWEEARRGGRNGRHGEGRGHRHALVPLNWSLNTGHKTRLAPYTSSLHVKGWLHCWGLTAHLTCLVWKKREISLPVSPLTTSLVLTNQLAGHFSRKDDFFRLVLNGEQEALGCLSFSQREREVLSSVSRRIYSLYLMVTVSK